YSYGGPNESRSENCVSENCVNGAAAVDIDFADPCGGARTEPSSAGGIVLNDFRLACRSPSCRRLCRGVGCRIAAAWVSATFPFRIGSCHPTPQEISASHPGRIAAAPSQKARL